MPVSPATSVRISEPLRECVERYGRERRWTFGETTRVALEQLVGFDSDSEPEQPVERQAS